MNKKNYESIINKIKSDNLDIVERKINYIASHISILFIKELTDKASLSEQVVKPLIRSTVNPNINAKIVIDNIIFAVECKLEYDSEKIETYILQGKTVLLFSNDRRYIVINFKKVEHRQVPIPDITYTARGPKDCFVEHMETNISLLRYRLKDKNLKIDYQVVGKRTKSKVAVAYFKDIANDKIVNEVKKRISDIDVGGIYESGELQAYMLNKKTDLFPQMGIIERSDMACGALLEGKVVILVDGSGLALVAPKVFSEFLWSCDDIYDNKYFGFFSRLLRIVALILSFTVSSIYVAIVSFHNDMLPSNYIILIAEARSKVPFNALVEVLLIEFIVELLREAIIRVPSKIGTAVSIVGAIIIGESAISAGIFSPLLLIVVSISLISSFVPSDFTLVNPFRLLKFLLIIATGILGFYGFTLGIVLIIAHLVSINSFGVAYMAPFAPFNTKDAAKSLMYDKTLASRRPYFLMTKDKYRSKNQQ